MNRPTTISFAIPVCNELDEIKRLLEFLFKYKRSVDEVCVLYDSVNGTIEVEEYLNSIERKLDYFYVKGEFKNHFADWKNMLNQLCHGDYIFQLDADELITIDLLNSLPEILESNTNIDLIYVPRINTVNGLTQEYINKWGWRVDSKGRVNFPDYQHRIYKNNDVIQWKNKVHEVITGHTNYSMLPTDDIYCIIHTKTLERQVKQNDKYDRI